MTRTQWDNSPELREAVGRELDNWATWSRQGAMVNLGYPRQIAGETPPESDPPAAVDERAALRTDALLAAWSRYGQIGERGVFLLRLRYIERRPVESIAYHYRRKWGEPCSDARARAMLDEAEFVYWCLVKES